MDTYGGYLWINCIIRPIHLDGIGIEAVLFPRFTFHYHETILAMFKTRFAHGETFVFFCLNKIENWNTQIAVGLVKTMGHAQNTISIPRLVQNIKKNITCAFISNRVRPFVLLPLAHLKELF